MARPGKLPEATTLRVLREKGWTLADIGKEYGVTAAAVQKKLARYGQVKQRVIYTDILPWKIETIHQTSGVMKKFRSILKQRNHEPMTAEEERQLREWLEGLEATNSVVAYHPDAPPNIASTHGGFYYVERRPEDTWIIRDPDLK